MSSISRLAAIAQRAGPVLRASVPARFAPNPTTARDAGFGDTDGWDVEEQWLAQPPVSAAPVRLDRDATDRRHERQRSFDAPPEPGRSEASATPAAPGSPPRVERVIEEHHHHHHVVADARVRPDDLEAAPPSQPMPEPLTVPFAGEPTRLPAAKSEPPSRRSSPVHSLTIVAPQARRALPAEGGAPAAAPNARRAVQPPAAHDPPSPVHITIGRIEIVANRPAPTPAARQVAPVRERPGPDLDAYLKDHR